MWDALLDQNLAYQRSIPAPDGGGGATRTWATKIAAMPCSVQSASSRTVYDFAQRGIQINRAIYTTSDLDALLAGGPGVGDRIVGLNGMYYIVQGSNRDQNLMISSEPIYRLDCQTLVE